MRQLKLLSLAALCAVSGCGSFTQWHRDNLRYSTFVRGEESYVVGNGTDSLKAMKDASEAQSDFYKKYRTALKELDPYTAYQLALVEQMRQQGQATGGQNTAQAPATSTSPVTSSTPADQGNSSQPLTPQRGADMAPTATNPRAKGGRIQPTLTGGVVSGSVPLGKSLINSTGRNDGVMQPGVVDMQADPDPKRTLGGDRTFRYTPGTVNQLSTGNPVITPVVSNIWPLKNMSDLNSTTTTEYADGKPAKTVTQGPNEESVRALSSLTSAAQLRDLLTEPSFPSALVPIKKDVRLGCLPPSDNVFFEAMDAARLAANAADNNNAIRKIVDKEGNSVDGDVGISRKLEAQAQVTSQTFAVKAIQETQKTWFLQWALFRLCEAGVNSPELRNTVPVVIHDIVRRSAEMSDSAEGEITARIKAEEETRRAEINRMAQLELEREKRETSVQTLDLQQKVVDSQAALKAKEIELAKMEEGAHKRRIEQMCIDSKVKTDPKVSFDDVKKACLSS
jgi:hypothetical protein